MSDITTAKVELVGENSKPVSLLEPGDIVSCESCDADVLLVIAKPYFGQADYVEKCFAPIQNITRGSLTKCEKCGGMWGRAMYVHIRGKGWAV